MTGLCDSTLLPQFVRFWLSQKSSPRTANSFVTLDLLFENSIFRNYFNTRYRFMDKKDPEMGRFRCTGKWWGSEAWIENWKPAEGRVSNQHQKKLHSTVQNFKSINGLYGSTPSNAKIIIFPFLLAENSTFSGLLAMRALRGKKSERQSLCYGQATYRLWSGEMANLAAIFIRVPLLPKRDFLSKNFWSREKTAA